MEFEKKNWLDRECEYPDRRVLYPSDGGAERSYRVERDEGIIYEEGDCFDAATMNDFERRVGKLGGALAEGLATHTADEGNPHRVTKEQLGLGHADDTPDEDKSVHDAAYANKLGEAGSEPDALRLQPASGTPKGNLYLQNVGNTSVLTGIDGVGSVPVYNAARLNGQAAGYYATASGLTTVRNTANSALSTAQAAMPKGGGTFTDAVRWTNGANHTEIFMGAGSLGAANMDFRTSGAGYLFRDTNGNFKPISCSNLNTASSRRYKRDVRPMQLAEAEKLLEAEVCGFYYKADSGYDDGHRHYGLVAEDLAEIDEGYVYRDRGRVEGVRYQALTAPLLRLAQAQGEEITGLKERVARLEELVAQLAGTGSGEADNGI